ncbi:MAG: lantibiotic biosynthesis protein [Herpetosiphonaceae bacterium]|nr:MAG: lantibiotic biosynthesis protein [Herpetosiphonaceae bacterium]
MQWLYVKLFHGPSQQRADYLVLNVVQPVAHTLLEQGAIAGYFYILYAEGGPHVRFRMQGEHEQLEGIVRPLLERAIPEAFQQIEQIPLQPGRSSPLEGAPRPFPSFEYDTYEPEYEKYGGKAGMSISERHFQDSSEAAIAVIAGEHRRQLRRQQAALLLIEALLDQAAGEIPQRAAFYARCRDYWVTMTAPSSEQQAEWYTYFDQRYSAAQATLARQMQGAPAEPLVSIVTHFREQTGQTLGDLLRLEGQGLLETPIPMIVQSYIHMLCNRMGITILEEAFLLHLLHRWYDAGQTAAVGSSADR